MTSTQAAAKRQKMAHDALFPTRYLPVPVIDNILKCLDLSSLVQAAGCSSSWRKEIYGDNHPQLWSVIEFVEWDRQSTTDIVKMDELNKTAATAARMTDDQLGALLRNCKAVERCKVLKLRGCLKIRGSGLEPLRGSCVLQEIDLRLLRGEVPNQKDEHDVYLHPTVDVSVVLPILSSMAPMAKSTIPASKICRNKNSLGLSLVKFDTIKKAHNFYSRFPKEVADWLFQFHQALQVAAEEHHAICGYCKGKVLDGKNEDWKLCIMGTAYCERCEQYSCGEGSCPSTWFCLDCSVQSCQPMGIGSHGQCPNHKMVYSCKSCDKLQCEDCFDGFMCANDECCNEYCSDETKDCLDLLRSCDVCQSEEELRFFCPECIEEHERNCQGPAKDGVKKPEMDEEKDGIVKQEDNGETLQPTG